MNPQRQLCSTNQNKMWDIVIWRYALDVLANKNNGLSGLNNQSTMINQSVNQSTINQQWSMVSAPLQLQRKISKISKSNTYLFLILKYSAIWKTVIRVWTVHVARDAVMYDTWKKQHCKKAIVIKRRGA